ncbi:Adenine methyltransferase [Petrocella atlantisensis]|uniref:Adenine methyltransferase n=1 Tax=Petrocella atlantisensis TaxID=2173034 RepID=A0A3P7S3F1_9FIRM|nr:site-specific DNA-methyltransferase [Petrocella atlantisensis]VDN47269.1 Adenine methyltransferase [Petrocella atlantisensis]
MNEKKVPENINDFVGDNIKALASLFPSAVKDGKLDIVALKEELGQFEEVDKEKYELTWAGKQEAKKKAQEDVFGKTLNYIPEDSKDATSTKNLYIEGDNLEVLKLLRQNYYRSIKMIYIDPPYNTGNDFVYNDRFKMNSSESDFLEGTTNEDGEKLQKNPISTNRFHANWINMMYPRIKIAKDLLKDDGVIFISIDSREVANLRKICDEIFGEDNFISNVTVVNNLKGRSDDEYIATAHENLLIYRKSDKFVTFGIPIPEEYQSEYKEADQIGKYRLLGLRKRGSNSKREDRPNMYYPIYVNNNTLQVSLENSNGFDEIVYPKLSDGSDGRWRWGRETTSERTSELVGKFISIRKEFDVYQKDYLLQNGIQRVVKPKSIWTGKEFSSDSGTLTFKELMGDKSFTNPKSLGLLKYCIHQATKDEDIILDFFAGSATTAQAVMQSNLEYGFKRKFIMVQLPEIVEENSDAYKAGYKNICEIGKERIRRSGEQIKKEIKDNIAQLKIDEVPHQDLDVGFKVFRAEDTNIKWNLIDSEGQIDTMAMTHTPDLADFTLDFKDIDVVYEIMLRQKDIPLSEKMEKLTDIGMRTYLYGSAYIVCLETEITEMLIDKLAALNPLPIKFVFRDSAFKDDINLKDDTFRRLKNLIERNSGTNKSAYTVEFI